VCLIGILDLNSFSAGGLYLTVAAGATWAISSGLAAPRRDNDSGHERAPQRTPAVFQASTSAPSAAVGATPVPEPTRAGKKRRPYIVFGVVTLAALIVGGTLGFLIAGRASSSSNPAVSRTSDPATAVRAYLAAFARGDGKTVCADLTLQARATVDTQGGSVNCPALVTRAVEVLGVDASRLRRVQVVAQSQRGDLAIVTAILGSNHVAVHVQKVGGKWRIASTGITNQLLIAAGTSPGTSAPTTTTSPTTSTVPSTAPAAVPSQAAVRDVMPRTVEVRTPSEHFVPAAQILSTPTDPEER
jgi:hypothetical protein